MRSIRFFLVASILATLTLMNFIAAVQGYQSSMAEAEVLFDNQLQDVARLVSQIDVSEQTGALSLENDIIFQRWEGGRLSLASTAAPAEPITALAPGFGFANFAGYRWRTYAQQVNAGAERHEGQWVLVGERTDLRFLLAENVVLESVTPILLSIPIVGLLVFSVVTLGLRPLNLLSRELKNKGGGRIFLRCILPIRPASLNRWLGRLTALCSAWEVYWNGKNAFPPMPRTSCGLRSAR